MRRLSQVFARVGVGGVLRRILRMKLVLVGVHVVGSQLLLQLGRGKPVARLRVLQVARKVLRLMRMVHEVLRVLRVHLHHMKLVHAAGEERGHKLGLPELPVRARLLHRAPMAMRGLLHLVQLLGGGALALRT